MKKKIIFNLIVLALVAGAAVILIWPLWDSVKAAKQEIESGKSELEAVNKLLAKTKTLKDDYELVKGQAEKVFISLPKEKDLPDLMVQFESLAATHGLVLESISFGDFEKSQSSGGQAVSFEEEIGEPASQTEVQTSVAKSIFRSLPVTLSVSGSYQALKKYISGLETNIRSMNIESINMGGGGEGGESPAGEDSFSFDLELSVYYQ
jgi:Tfp pilus assembly protein PilO